MKWARVGGTFSQAEDEGDAHTGWDQVQQGGLRGVEDRQDAYCQGQPQHVRHETSVEVELGTFPLAEEGGSVNLTVNITDCKPGEQ